MMRLFEFWTFYYSFLLLMDFFLKEAVHQRAFCSYSFFFVCFYRGKYCTTLFFFSFFFSSLLKTISGGTASTRARGAIAQLQLGAEGITMGASPPRVARIRSVSPGRLGQICDLVLQWEGLVANSSWFYFKSLISVSYHDQFHPLVHQFPFFLFSKNRPIREAKIKTGL